MNGEIFYQEFKQALKLFNLSWAEMSELEVTGEVHFTFGTYEYVLRLTPEQE